MSEPTLLPDLGPSRIAESRPSLPAEAAENRTGMDRRHFVRVAVAAAAGTGVSVAAPGLAQEARPPATPAPQQQQPPPPPPVPLGNGQPPALQFQAYPGGTGAYLEKLARERGRAAFERATLDVAAWQGTVPTTEEAIAFLPVHRLAALIRERKLSPVTLTEIYLDRLKRYDPVLLCAVSIMEGPAREAAQQAEAEIRNGGYRGPLHGIPYGLKDLFAVRGTRTTWGASDFEHQWIDVDAEVVVRLREAGAILIAKLATGQFASGDNWYRGQTKNPWNLEQGSSGSSAGPGSATAAGCVAFSIGTETQGSIVSPSIRCGLSALRPTFGRVSRYGGMVLAWSMDKVGPMCRSVEDCALVFNVLHGADEKDPATVTAPFRFDRNPDLSKLRIGYDERAPEEFVERLRTLGASPRPMQARPDSRSIGSALGVESAAAFDYYVGTLPPEPEPAGQAGGGRGRGAPPAGRGGQVGPGRGAQAGARGGQAGAGRGGQAGGRGGGGGGASGRFTRGRSVTAVDFLQTQRRRLVLMHEMAALMRDFDMYVSGAGDVGLTNQTGHPAVVLPYTWREGEHPQPQCTTIIGNLFADDLILSVAHAYQRVTDWHTRHPTLAAVASG